jgi:predicted pyridoxine 5'-phosphate oxidase superfamily flavin-nucleotide-binding protein
VFITLITLYVEQAFLLKGLVANQTNFKMGILTAEIKEFVKQQKLGFYATVCQDGTPNLSPKGTTIVWDDDHLAFADIHSPGTIKNLLTNPAIEINMVDIFIRKGYRFKGIGQVFSEGTLFHEIIAYYREGGAKYDIKHIVLIRIQSIALLVSPVYDTGATEEEVIKRYTDYWNTIYPVSK